jgi:hypothetical protein
MPAIIAPKIEVHIGSDQSPKIIVAPQTKRSRCARVIRRKRIAMIYKYVFIHVMVPSSIAWIKRTILRFLVAA